MKSILKKYRLKHSFKKTFEIVYVKASSIVDDCIFEMINIYDKVLKIVKNEKKAKKDKLKEMNSLMKRFNEISSKYLN